MTDACAWPQPLGLRDLLRLAIEDAAGTARTAGRTLPRQGGDTPRPSGEEGIDETVVRLVARAQAGDAEAFGEIYDRYVDLIYRYIYYRVGSKQLAEDLTSETFLRALRRIQSFTWQGRDVGAWFVTIARNLVTDHYKSSRYRLEITTHDLIAATGDSPQEGTPEDEVLAGITNATLLAAIKRLGAEQQECIVLRFLQSLSVSETAEIMGKNEGAVKALQYRAVRSLGRLLPPGAI
ncbi:MAG TPA: ECF subfamily RNA polymerase sigma factor, BldN family [Mycobacteriales bacterium]